MGLSRLTSMDDWLSATTSAESRSPPGALGYERAAEVKHRASRRDPYYLYEVHRRLAA